jgi:capsular exopolysaccharide synthesis family protein
LLSEVEKAQLDELDPPVYTELLLVREQVRIANDAAKGLPEQIATLDQGGGESLSSEALDNLRQQLQLQLLTSSSGGSRVMDTAVVSSPVTTFSGGPRSIILAVIAALLLGVLGALMLQYFDRRVRDASQVTSYVGLPVLARVAMIPGAGNPHPPSLLDESSTRYLEAFRMLRTNLGLDSSQGQVILISSPEEEEGKTTIAANLARAVALQGRRVLLIDGNLRKPGIAQTFELAKTDGLSEFLTGKNELQEYITQADSVDILPVREASVKSAEELSSPRMKALLEKARQAYDVVILDSAPVTGYADTKILAKEVDAVLLVLQADVSTLDLARDSKQALETAGVQVAGFVLNKEKSKEFKQVSHLLHNLLKLKTAESKTRR